MALFKTNPEILLEVKGMHCGKCVARVTEALENTEGVTSVEVSLEAEEARVQGSAESAALIAAIEALGFSAAVKA